MTIDHEQAQLLAAMALDEPLAASEATDLDVHLATCHSCRTVARGIAADHRLLGAALAPVAVPPRVRVVVIRAARGRERMNPWLALAAAALLVLALIAATLLAGGAEQVAVTASCERPSFGQPTTIHSRQARARPSDVATGDFNGDGKNDFVVSNFWDEYGLAVVLGRGDGTFGQPVQYRASSVIGMDVADVNGDGQLDVIGAGPQNASVFLGDGLGGFAEGWVGPNGYARDVVLERFDSDEILDLAIATDRLTILRGDGRGGFSDPTFVSTEGTIASLVTADLNRDDRPDIALVTDEHPDVFVFLGDSNGGVGVARQFRAIDPDIQSSPVDRSFITAGDVSGDGWADLVTGSRRRDWTGLVVLSGDGLGGFSPPEFIDVEPGPDDAIIADIDGDGRQDVAAVVQDGSDIEDGSNLLLFKGDVQGAFAMTSRVDLGDGRHPDATELEQGYGITSADFNGDGLADLVTSNVDSASASVLINACMSDQ